MHAEENPLVSVIIPTLGRPELVRRAVASAFAQTHTNVEVIVVSDGPDPATEESLRDCNPRVKYLRLAQRSGPAAARSAGVQASSGKWINLLDDDDELLPQKIAGQLALTDAGDETTMIACRCIFRQGEQRHVWPERPIREGEDIGDYLLLRPGLRGRPGIINLHSLLIPRALAVAVPMPDFADHEDWAWLLALSHVGHAKVRFLWQAQAVYHISASELTRSRRFNWAESLAWADSHRHWLSRKAYNSFLASKVSLKARRAKSWKGFWIVARGVLCNHPGRLDLTFLAGIGIAPIRLTNWIWRRSLQRAS